MAPILLARPDADKSAGRLAAPIRPNVLDPGSSGKFQNVFRKKGPRINFFLCLEEADCLDAQGRVKSLTIYSSHVSPEGLQPKDGERL